jgi:hypothetical protein
MGYRVSYPGYRYLILCEDKRQYYFVQSYLRCKGVSDRRIRSFGLPQGGDAKQFVKSNVPIARNLLRANEKDILIVVRDADTEK